MRYFIAVADAGTMTGAADRLHVAQPALSQNIKSIEAELGVALFIRSRQGMQLTEAGEVLLEHAHMLMRQVENARTSVRDIATNPSGIVALAMPASVSKVLIIPLYQRLQALYPNIVLHNEEGLVGNLRKLFDSGFLDLMIDTGPESIEGIRVEPLLEEELYLVQAYNSKAVPPPEIRLAELSGTPIYVLSTRHGMGRVVRRYFEEGGLQLNALPHQFGLHPTLQLVCEGHGNVILPWSAIHELVKNKRVQARRIVEPPMYRPVCILVQTAKPITSAMEKVIEQIKESVRQVHSEGLWRGKLSAALNQ